MDLASARAPRRAARKKGSGYENGLDLGQPRTQAIFSYKNAVLSGYITTLKNKQKLDVSSEGPSLLTKGLRSKRRVSAYFLR